MGYSFRLAARVYMHHPTERIAHTTAFVTPVVEHWLERDNSSMGPPHDGSILRLLPWSYVSLICAFFCFHSSTRDRRVLDTHPCLAACVCLPLGVCKHGSTCPLRERKTCARLTCRYPEGSTSNDDVVHCSFLIYDFAHKVRIQVRVSHLLFQPVSHDCMGEEENYLHARPPPKP